MLGVLTEQPKRSETSEENLIPSSKERSESPAIVGERGEDQSRAKESWLEVEERARRGGGWVGALPYTI
jgi:hypothetical protein